MNKNMMLLHRDLSSQTRYRLAVIIFIFAFLTRLLVFPANVELPFITFYPATVAVFYFLGIGPGLIVTALSATSGYYAFISPQWSFVLENRGYHLVAIYLTGSTLSAIVIYLLQNYAYNLYQTLTQLQDSENRFRSFMDCGNFLSWMKDEQGQYVYLNQHYEKCFELKPGSGQGKSDAELFSQTVTDKFIKTDLEVLQNNKAITTEEVSVSSDGKSRWWLCTRFPYSDTSGRRYVGGIAADITERKSAEEQIENLAFYDPLTNLPNRRLLMDRLKHILNTAERHSQISALLFIDLDNFKALNDTYGHNHGDLLLLQVAQRLQANIRKCDTLARFGGDEFVILLENLSSNKSDAAAQANIAGEKVLRVLGEPYLLDGKSHNSTSSIGITLFGDNQEDIEGPLKRADLALYQAKESGRNSLRFFDPQIQAAMIARSQLEEELRIAITQQQLTLHYQPQIAETKQLIGAEALVRWQHPQHGMVPPGEFIPVAEDTGLIIKLGQWVLETACVQLARWSAQPACTNLTLSVNVSPHQFGQPDFVEQVLSALAKTRANPKLLKLELTESMLALNVEDVIEKMSVLRTKGISFSLDDFGTGFSSLAYLKQLPLDQLKIDQSFVKDIGSDTNNTAIAKTIIALARSLELTVIAEGVETEVQRSFLAAYGCTTYQGYLFSRPLPISEFQTFADTYSTHIDMDSVS